MQTAQRWKRRKEARPPEILEAALAVFAEKGFAATRMEDIARSAGVTKGTIYLYFESKEAVFRGLVQQSIGTALSGIVETTQHFKGSARELLRLVLTALGEFVRTSDRVVLLKILIAEAGNFPDMARFYRKEIINKGLSLMGDAIALGVSRGEFREIAPQHAARLCVAPILLAAFWRTTFAQFDSEPYDYQGLIDTHIDTLLRGLAPDKGAT
ncbi:MAG TPA: TetR/AcrR family transcriptional regulator [Rhizomicrobium sp.]|nr:TetR/AcrR family transcriptional regulator [Rhizomicrobium sp.]